MPQNFFLSRVRFENSNGELSPNKANNYKLQRWPFSKWHWITIRVLIFYEAMQILIANITGNRLEQGWGKGPCSHSAFPQMDPKDKIQEKSIETKPKRDKGQERDNDLGF